MPEPAIYAEHLQRSFGAVAAVSDVSFTVPQGTIFGLLGPNGAGKTTTVNMVLGALAPHQGKLRVLGCRLPEQADRMRPGLGVMLTATGVYGQSSVWNNLIFWGRLYRMPGKVCRERAEYLLKRLDLWRLRTQAATTLSTGEKRKLGVARALIARPRLVILDEPTAGLDVPGRAALHQDLMELVGQEGLTVFLTTHYLDEAQRLCDQVAVMAHGQVVAAGSPDELAQQSQKPMVTVRGPGVEEFAEMARQLPGVHEVSSTAADQLQVMYAHEPDSVALNRALVAAGAQVRELLLDHGELERTFLDLVKEPA